MEVQLRNIFGGIRTVGSVKEAFEEAEKNKDIWKISWSEGDHRIRLVRSTGDSWYYELITVEHIAKVSKNVISGLEKLDKYIECL